MTNKAKGNSDSSDFFAEEGYLMREIQEVAMLGYYYADFVEDRWKSSSMLDRIFGIGPDYYRSIQVWIELIDPAMKDEMDHYLKEIIKKRLPFDKEYRIINQESGKVRWVYGRGKLEFDQQGKAIKLFGTIQDITDRKLAEIELGKFKFFSDHSKLAQGLADETGKIIYVNAAMENLLGYSKDELYSFGKADLDKFFNNKSILSLKDEIVEKNHFLLEEMIVRKDKTVFPAELMVTVNFLYGKGYGYFSIQDITERKKAEANLQKLKDEISGQYKRLELVLDNIPVGIILVTEKGKIWGLNPIAKDQMAILAGDYKPGKRISHIGNISLDKLLIENIAGERKWKRINAGSRSFEVNARPTGTYLDETSWVIVIRDITEELEIQLRMKQQDRLAVVGQLAAGIAHDFNNIMAVIKLYAQIGLRKEGIPPDMKDALGIILEQADAANKLTGQVLDFSRRPLMEPRPLNLVLFLKELAKLLQRTMPESIHIGFKYGLGDFMLEADPTAMQQMLMSLAVNARNAMPEGGELKIELSMLEPEAKIKCQICGKLISGKWIKVKIADNGIGIQAHILPHIFEPFFTSDESGISAGLGLPQVLGIIKQHKGHINVETVPGVGTSFSIFLPLLKDVNKLNERNEEGANPMGKNELILLVIHNQSMRKAVLATLVSLNYRVIEAMSGSEALRVVHHSFHPKADIPENQISLVISEEILPGMKGEALFNEIRQLYPALPLLMLGDCNMKEKIERMKNDGLEGWICSPENLGTIPNIIRGILDRSC